MDDSDDVSITKSSLVTKKKRKLEEEKTPTLTTPSKRARVDLSAMSSSNSKGEKISWDRLLVATVSISGTATARAVLLPGQQLEFRLPPPVESKTKGKAFKRKASPVSPFLFFCPDLSCCNPLSRMNRVVIGYCVSQLLVVILAPLVSDGWGNLFRTVWFVFGTFCFSSCSQTLGI
jgi:hypothetical protein